MKLAKIILIAICVFGAAAASRVAGQTIGANTADAETFTRLTENDIKLLLEDVAELNPKVLQGLDEDPELRKAQVANLRQLLAFASEAKRTGLANRKDYRNELEYIRLETMATNYDRHVSKGKPPRMLPFGHISNAAVAKYWGETPSPAITAATKAARKARFEEFLNTKVNLLKAQNPSTKEPADDEIAQARDLYAKIVIYADEYQRRAALLPLSLRQKIKLQVKLQQAQFLARLYAERVAGEANVSDDEVASFIRAHPEYDTEAQRAKAEKVLARVTSGEDFAKLANEFSEDPGNKNQKGELQGGLYQNVGVGVMVPQFEKAALALGPGQVAQHVVETDFGFHIVKLESKSSTAEPQTYDVRHILFSTGVGNPAGTNAGPVPVKQYLKERLESEKEQEIIDRLVIANKISVPDDFEIPAAAVRSGETKPAPKAKKRTARKRT